MPEQSECVMDPDPSSFVICFYFLFLLFACIFSCPSALKMFFLIANRENKFREFHYEW